MAKKKSKPVVSKKSTSHKSSIITLLKKRPWLTLFAGLFIILAGSFAYNKYLDYKNVQDMKTLLSNFQQLEKDMEEQTDKKALTNLKCGYSGEKFNQKESCNLILVNETNDSKYYNNFFAKSKISSDDRCRMSVGGDNIGSIACYIPNKLLDHLDIRAEVNSITN